MKRKREAGQAFILVLILLAIGAVIVIPMLVLTATSLKNSQIIGGRAKSLYAADAAQEFVMWKLRYTSYASSFTQNGQSDNFTVDVCGSPVRVSLVMHAVPGIGGMTLATDDVIRPTKTVSPSAVANGSTQTFTYIIRMEQLSNNNSQGLDAVYDVLPSKFGTNIYVAGSSYISVDGGAWESIGDPSRPGQGSNPSGSYAQERLRWPFSGNFTSPTRDFAVRQVKELKFQVRLTLPSNANDYVLFNYAVIKVGSVTTFSGQVSPVTIGNGSKQDQDGMLTVTKTSSPSIIVPGVAQDITYTITVSNNDTSTHSINNIVDNLPPAFSYVTGSTVGFGNGNPTTANVTLNGVTRQQLVWTVPSNQKQITSGTSRTLTYIARTSTDVSGAYYNEVLMVSDFAIPAIFSTIGLTAADFSGGYSWNAGTVIVPAYDSSATSGNVTTNTNLSFSGGGVVISSFQVR